MRCLMWIGALGMGLLAPAASAQETPQRFALGIGVFLNPVALLSSGGGGFDNLVVPVGLGNFTVPMRVGSRVRIEPELGLTKFNAETTIDTGDFTARTAATVLRVGIGVSVVVLEEGGLRTYTGLRVGLSRFTESNQQTTPGGSFEATLKRTDSHIGVAFGGEYFLARRFSMGAELQVTRLSFGDPNVEATPGPSPPPTTSSSLWSTNGLIALRFYVI